MKRIIIEITDAQDEKYFIVALATKLKELSQDSGIEKFSWYKEWT